MIYLDSTILIAYLYEEYDAVERFAQARRMFQAIRVRETEAAISFYALPELYRYVESHFSQEEANTTFRLSLVTLFEIPLTVLPYLKRTERSLWRHRIRLRDSSDEPHIAIALAHGCEAIVTYDQHFQDVAELIQPTRRKSSWRYPVRRKKTMISRDEKEKGSRFVPSIGQVSRRG